MRGLDVLPVVLLLVFAVAWILERGTSPVPLPLVVAWTLGVGATGIWLGVVAQASLQGPPPPRNDDIDGGAW